MFRELLFSFYEDLFLSYTLEVAKALIPDLFGTNICGQLPISLRYYVLTD